jgi:hypothetical protein
MPNKINLLQESCDIMAGILNDVYKVTTDEEFDRLLKKCNDIPYGCEVVLKKVNEELVKLLSPKPTE